MRKLIIVLVLMLAIGLFLSGCGVVKTTDEAVKDVINQFGLSDLLLGNDDGDLMTSVDVTTSGMVNTMALPGEQYALKATYTRGIVTRQYGDVVIDEVAGVATVEAVLTVPGQFELYDAELNPLGTKDATMTGNASYVVKKFEKGWRVVEKKMHLTSHELSPIFGDLIITPQPAQKGDQLRIRVPITGETDVIYRAAAFSRAGGTRTKLVDNGSLKELDETAKDGIYSGFVIVHENAVVGKHLGTLKAVNLHSLLDITTDENGTFVMPVKMTIDTFEVEIGE